MLVQGINFEVDWRKFKKGTSIFIPCLNPRQAIKDIHVTTKRLRVDVIHKITIVDGIRGVRIWRM